MNTQSLLHLSTLDQFGFVKELNITFQLEVDGKECQILSGNVEEFNINLHPYGYEAVVYFSSFDDDEISQLFVEEKVMKACLTLKSTDPEKENLPIFELKGIVGERSYQVLGKGIQKKSICLYKICFTDPAQVSWGHHFPIKIFVDQTMKDVIDSEKNPLISITYDWEKLNEVSSIIAFSLEFRNGLPISQQVSFYSFLMWYLHQANGILEYNYKDHSYAILGEKSDDMEPIPVAEWVITPAICQFFEPTRYHERTIRHSPEMEEHSDEDNPNGFQSVRKDGFDDFSYQHFPEQVFQKVQSKLSPEKPMIRFCLTDLADPFDLEQLIPGNLIEIRGDEKKGGTWCEDAMFKNQIFRLVNITFKAKRTTALDGTKRVVQPYRLEIEVLAEAKDETYVLRPKFQSPVYPFSIPGKIFCEIGDKDQTTFNLVKGKTTPLGHYEVKVPLAGVEKKVVVPFIPDFISGQSYFPLCKDQQVMLSMYFQTAKIERVLDWQPLARLPLDTQANQIVFASNGKDQFFIQRHEYRDGRDSVFTIKQSSSEDQTQTIQIQEKELLITVEEKGKNSVFIQLHRETGLALKLQDDTEGVTQTSIYNGTSITHTSEGKDGKSTISQKPDSIFIECKNLMIKCDEGVIEATKTLAQKAANKAFIEAPIVNIKDKVKMGG